ncbi:unnamed protein product [Cyclocybe aegerita]|uniref:Uncharacterized protein n=1 Tax=Cyclocybe aegerita TaxID=1973307 RepID=A0A8S0WKB1_CYCAE|nr:unnamed protein product [Cyclocybe aegerita]
MSTECTIIGIELTEEHLLRLATRISHEEVDDARQAYEIVVGEAIQLGFDVPPTKHTGPTSDPEKTTIMFAVFDDIDSAHIMGNNNAHRLPKAIEWLTENGLPEAAQMELKRATFEP